MGKQPTVPVRSGKLGEAIVFYIQKKPIPNSKRGLCVVEIAGGSRSVVPNAQEFEDGTFAVFIPAGNVVPDQPYFDWMGSGRKKIVRVRKILGVLSTGIVVPFAGHSALVAHVFKNSVRVGDNLAAVLGIYKPNPLPERKTNPRSKSSKPKRSEAEKFVEAAEKNGAKFKIDESSGDLLSTVSIPERLVNPVAEVVKRKQKTPEAEAMLKALSERAEAARQRAYNGGVGVPIPKHSGVGEAKPGVEAFENDRQNTERLQTLVEYMNKKFNVRADRQSVVPLVMGTIDGMHALSVKTAADNIAKDRLLSKLTDASKRYVGTTQFINDFLNGHAEAAINDRQVIGDGQCPAKLGEDRCDRPINHTGPHRANIKL